LKEAIKKELRERLELDGSQNNRCSSRKGVNKKKGQILELK